MGKKVVFVVNAEWFLVSHHLSLALALQDAGYEVTLAAAIERNTMSAITATGLPFIELKKMTRGSMNPVGQLVSILELYRIYRRERPDIAHHVTIKPVLYGSLAAMLAGIESIVNWIPGLGLWFVGRTLKVKVVRFFLRQAYRLAFLRKSTIVIFENEENRQLFIDSKTVRPEQANVVFGSGANHEFFTPTDDPDGIPVVGLAGRLLENKGVRTLVEASRLLKQRGIQFRAVLIGIPDDKNPDSIPEDLLREWEREGVIEWWGLQDNMIEVFKKLNIFTLPSTYGEGIPKALVEAALCEKPLITTDIPGCREIVCDEENGFVVPIRDSEGLAHALEELITNPKLRVEMGKRGREIALTKFTEKRSRERLQEIYSHIRSSFNQ